MFISCFGNKTISPGSAPAQPWLINNKYKILDIKSLDLTLCKVV